MFRENDPLVATIIINLPRIPSKPRWCFRDWDFWDLAQGAEIETGGYRVDWVVLEVCGLMPTQLLLSSIASQERCRFDSDPAPAPINRYCSSSVSVSVSVSRSGVLFSSPSSNWNSPGISCYSLSFSMFNLNVLLFVFTGMRMQTVSRCLIFDVFTEISH